MKKKETILEHWLYMMFSAKYRRQMELERGEEVWRKLDKDLPRAVGVIEDDEPRMKLFAQKITFLTPKERKNLILWLEHELYDLENNFCELTSSTVEKWESKWKQIYRTHLELLS